MKNWSAFFSGHSLEQDTISSQRQMRAFDSLISRACQYESDQKERRACVEKLFLLRREPFRDEVIAGRKTHVKQGSRSSRMYPLIHPPTRAKLANLQNGVGRIQMGSCFSRCRAISARSFGQKLLTLRVIYYQGTPIADAFLGFLTIQHRLSDCFFSLCLSLSRCTSRGFVRPGGQPEWT